MAAESHSERSSATLSPEELSDFAGKLAEWAATLSDNERALFKYVLELGRSKETVGSALVPPQYLDPGQFKRVSFRPFEVPERVPELDPSYFELMCW